MAVGCFDTMKLYETKMQQNDWGRRTQDLCMFTINACVQHFQFPVVVNGSFSLLSTRVLLPFNNNNLYHNDKQLYKYLLYTLYVYLLTKIPVTHEKLHNDNIKFHTLR
jgi:hypothetical protein